MTRKELIAYCLTFPAAYEDYPFDEDTGAENAWTVMRHGANKKSFAFIFERSGKLCVNLKCEPMYADFLRGIYPAITPGYHMNKAHWNTVSLDGSVPEDELLDLVNRSYDLIKPKLKNKKNPVSEG
jgi:predicted DNA-binding protein (MmcQ/YjbR family)